MPGSHETFWWLLALVGLAVVVFAVLLWLRLSREAERERRKEEKRQER
jgi:sensor domain CHASE-containing protein